MYRLTLSIVVLTFTVACATGMALRDKTISVQSGDTTFQVSATMGQPQGRQINGDLLAWQYCTTDLWPTPQHTFVTIVFQRNGLMHTVKKVYSNSDDCTNDDACRNSPCSQRFQQVEWN